MVLFIPIVTLARLSISYRVVYALRALLLMPLLSSSQIKILFKFQISTLLAVLLILSKPPHTHGMPLSLQATILLVYQSIALFFKYLVPNNTLYVELVASTAPLIMVQQQPPAVIVQMVTI